MKRATYISLFLLLVTNTLFAQTNQRLKVEGQAIIYEVPEEIIVSLDLTVKDSLYHECFSKAVETMETLKNTFKKNGIDTELIKAKGISVNEAYEWKNNQRSKTGYVANIALEVKGIFNQKFSDALLKSLNRKDLNINYRFAFGFSEEQKEELREEAIALAVKDAQQKAQAIAKAAGIQLASIANINYGADTPFYRPMNLVMEEESSTPAIKARADNFSGVDLNPKEQLIQKSISIEWLFTE
ncbi:SIMPL domain-containing protein [Carboxylicivirga taeanensis]|uniref:SIMPL domain-containing protein n=1 Tax=Carboxylicivirga taeanensis TaxID=1416875 RepID=UPI003F6E2BDF